MEAKYVGIDIGKEKNSVCLLDQDQEILDSFDFKHTIEDYENIISKLSKNVRIVIEPTGVYGLNLYYYVKKKGFNIRFCDTRSSNHTLRSNTAGIKQKTDKQDAKGLALHSIIHWKKCRESLPFISKIRGKTIILKPKFLYF